MPTDVPSLLRALMADDLNRPRLTWYGPGPERVELSAKLLDNWVAKTANTLVDTLDAGPGTRIDLDLPPHWRGAVWILAGWSAGAWLSVHAPADHPAGHPSHHPAGHPSHPGADVLVTTRPPVPGSTPTPDVTPGAPVVVAVALPALASSFGAPLEPDVIDAASEVRANGDVFVPVVRPDASDRALTHADPSSPAATSSPADPLAYGELFAEARRQVEHADWPDGVRLLVTTSGAAVVSPVGWLLAPLTVGGSVVLVDDTAHDDAAVDRISAQEGVTHRLIR